MNSEKEIQVFLNQICLQLGICDCIYNLEYFLSKDYYEVNEFITEIFLAEGFEKDEIPLNLFRRVQRKFIDRFGYEIYR